MDRFLHEFPSLIRPFALIVSLATGASSQPFSFGLEAGVPLTASVEAGPSAPASAATNRYIAGGFVELRLPRNLSLEFDVLYRHLHYSDSLYFPPFLSEDFEHVSAGTWEFPLLLKYHFPGDAVRPYISAGPAFDVVALKDRFTEFLELPLQTTTGTKSSSFALQNSLVAGLTAGAGVEIPAGRLRISPEIRYTRWLSPHFSPPYLLDSKQNQVEFLVGLRI